MPKRSSNQSFTLPGFALLIIVLFILVRSLSARNAYEIALSTAALLLLLALGIAGIWIKRRMAGTEAAWSFPLPLGASSGEPWLVASPIIKIPRFFRLHFIVEGRFYPQGYTEGASFTGCPVYAETSMPRRSKSAQDNTAKLNMDFPLGGCFRFVTSCRVRDIFGFLSIPCGVERERTLNVRSAPCGAKALRIDAQSGAEDRRNKSSSDEERYYMREYTPGDRFRDINWKSSERISTLITRISPDNQEKITRIVVYFRNYGPQHAPSGNSLRSRFGSKKNQVPSMDDLWLLDRAKARLAWFLRKVREEKDSYVFQVHCAGKSWDLNDDEDINAFLEEISDLPFSPSHNDESSALQTEGELYVFSTACDRGLPSFVLSRQGKPLTLFLTQNPIKGTAAPLECERLYLRDFFNLGPVFRAGQFRVRRNTELRVNCDHMMIDYAEVRL